MSERDVHAKWLRSTLRSLGARRRVGGRVRTREPELDGYEIAQGRSVR